MDVYRILGLVLVAGFYGLYAVMQFTLRRRNIVASVLVHGGRRGRALAVELALMLWSIGMTAVQVASLITGWQWRMPGLVRVLGLLLMAAVVAMLALTTLTIRGALRAGISSKDTSLLIVHGIYSQTRNPTSLAFDLLYVGTVLVCPNVATVLGAFLSIGLMHLQIRWQEAYSARELGEPYLAYCARTPRYLLFL